MQKRVKSVRCLVIAPLLLLVAASPLAAQSAPPVKVITPTDRTILPIPEPQSVSYTHL